MASARSPVSSSAWLASSSEAPVFSIIIFTSSLENFSFSLSETSPVIWKALLPHHVHFLYLWVGYDNLLVLGFYYHFVCRDFFGFHSHLFHGLFQLLRVYFHGMSIVLIFKILLVSQIADLTRFL